MDITRNKINELVHYIRTLGLEVNLDTHARGHQGFFLNNRIDISKKTPKEKVIQTLLHEFAHYINKKIEPDIKKSSINSVFHTEEDINDELILVTHFVDENSKLKLLNFHKSEIKKQISELDSIIKLYYPKFQRSKPFKEFNTYIRFSKAKYLLKHDRVRYTSPFLRRVEYFSVDTIDKDFNMPKAFSSYIKLRSYQRKQTRISSKINKLKKYYYSPSELFARFVEGIYIDKFKIKQIAPKAYDLFEKSLVRGDYFELYNVFKVLELI